MRTPPDVEHGEFVEYLRSNIQTYRPTLKDGLCNERIFLNVSFRELKIAKESNDLAKVSLESKQKSNELSVGLYY